MSLVLYNQIESVATLTLNLPEKLNAISIEVQSEIRSLVARIRNDATVRCVVVTGQGKAFCVGADLSSMKEPPAGTSMGEQMAQWMREVSIPMVRELRSLPIPVVCSVNGAAAGAGVSLALCGDVVVAAKSAYFYLPFLPKLGIVPDLGATWLLPRLLGPARAMGMSLLDERLSAEKAAQWGLIWQYVDDMALSATAADIAFRLAELPAHAIVQARRVLAAAETNSFDEQLEFEMHRQSELVETPEFREGVAAFAQKRRPNFHRH